MLAFVGYILLAIGVASTLPLLLNPFGLLPMAAPWAAWIGYPVFMVLGLLISSLGSKKRSIGAMFRVLGAILLLLGCAAALGIAAGAIGIVEFQNNMLSLVYLLVTGLLFGILGLVANHPAGKKTEPIESNRE